MKTLLIVWHSLTGGARQMAAAAARGACAVAPGADAAAVIMPDMDATPELRVRLLHAVDAVAADVLDADGYIFATPENLAAMAGLMKDFFDRTYYPVLDRINGRPYAVMVCAGSDGENAARQVARIATGWRLRAVAEPLIVCTRAQTPEAILAPKVMAAEALGHCAELGAALAAGLAGGIF